MSTLPIVGYRTVRYIFYLVYLRSRLPVGIGVVSNRVILEATTDWKEAEKILREREER